LITKKKGPIRPKKERGAVKRSDQLIKHTPSRGGVDQMGKSEFEHVIESLE
jgi:hypothetical protein